MTCVFVLICLSVKAWELPLAQQPEHKGRSVGLAQSAVHGIHLAWSCLGENQIINTYPMFDIYTYICVSVY